MSNGPAAASPHLATGRPWLPAGCQGSRFACRHGKTRIDRPVLDVHQVRAAAAHCAHVKSACSGGCDSGLRCSGRRTIDRRHSCCVMCQSANLTPGTILLRHRLRPHRTPTTLHRGSFSMQQLRMTKEQRGYATPASARDTSVREPYGCCYSSGPTHQPKYATAASLGARAAKRADRDTATIRSADATQAAKPSPQCWGVGFVPTLSPCTCLLLVKSQGREARQLVAVSEAA
eukprot:361461-Chlamydomonas_euryale.AAC.2